MMKYWVETIQCDMCGTRFEIAHRFLSANGCYGQATSFLCPGCGMAFSPDDEKYSPSKWRISMKEVLVSDGVLLSVSERAI